MVVSAAEKEEESSTESREVLDAFFVGRALADVLNEKVGSALGEFLSEVAKKDAERRRDMRDLQDEVRMRAREQQTRAIAASTPRSPAPAASAAPPSESTVESTVDTEASVPDLDSSVQGLGEEVSKAKDAVDELKKEMEDEK